MRDRILAHIVMVRRSGFTLIELLVVIAVIALLMSILVPALGRVRKKAMEIMCQTKVKQWSIAFRMYADDNNGYFPYPSLGAVTYPYSYHHGWWPCMRPYFKDYDMLLCPMATKLEVEGAKQPFAAHQYGSVDAGETEYTNWKTYRFSYSVNAWIFSFKGSMESRFGGGDVEEWRWKRMDNIKGADNVPLIGDSTSGEGHGGRPRETDIPAEYEALATEASNMGVRCIHHRHSCTVNHAFADGSARAVGLKELWRLQWHRQFNTAAGPIDSGQYPGAWPEWMRCCKSYPVTTVRPRGR